MTSRDPLLPGATLGVLGGGQLGRMFVHAAQAMGYATAVLDADPQSPAGLVSHAHVRTGYLDDAGLAALAATASAVTTEFENVPAAALDKLAASMPVAPSGAAARARVPSASNSDAKASPNATVLPDPVWAETIRSRPCASGSRTAACTAVGSA